MVSRGLDVVGEDSHLYVELFGAQSHDGEVDVGLAHSRLHIRPAYPNGMERSLDARLRSGSINDCIRAQAQPALLIDSLRGLLRALLSGHHGMCRRVLLRKREALLVDIHRHHLARAVRLCNRAAQQADWAGSEYHQSITRLDPRLSHHVHGHTERLHYCTLFQARAVRQLVAKVLGQRVVLGEGAIKGWSGCERHVGAQIVFALFAAHAHAARNPRLETDAIANFESGDFVAYGSDDATGLMAQHHGRLDDKVADGAMGPVVHVGAADAGVFDIDEDVVRGVEFGDGAVFEGDVVGFLEDEGEVLWG